MCVHTHTHIYYVLYATTAGCIDLGASRTIYIMHICVYTHAYIYAICPLCNCRGFRLR